MDKYEELVRLFKNEQGINYLKLSNRMSKMSDGIIRYQKDNDVFVGHMSKEQIEDMLGVIVTRRWKDAFALYAVREFIAWCLDNDVSDCNMNALIAKSKSTDIIRNGFFKSPEHLRDVLCYVLNDEFDDSVGRIYRAAAYVTFIGIHHDSVKDVLKSDVNLEDGYITFKDKIYPIYDCFVDDIKFAVDATEFHAYGATTLKSGEVKRVVHCNRRVQSDKLISLSMKSTDALTMTGVYNSFRDACRSRGIERSILPSDIYESGIFYRINESGFVLRDIDFQAFVNGADAMSAKAISIAESVLMDKYLAWKQEFSKPTITI